jgi:hypothetical protein
MCNTVRGQVAPHKKQGHSSAAHGWGYLYATARRFSNVSAQRRMRREKPG